MNKMDIDQKFKYADERDKCYGLAGIAISLNVWDGHQAIRQITIDGPESISFAPEAEVCANPRMSAKIAWNDQLRQYQLLMGMALSNLMSRAIALRRTQIGRDLRDRIFAIADADGQAYCALEPDETEVIFNKTYQYLNSLYSNAQVINAVRQFAETLQSRRTMTAAEVEEELARCLRR